jgi:pimeloyl-ACP methyl ester carboxylesterase
MPIPNLITTFMQTSYLFINGIRTHYLYWNLEDGAQPALLLHGLASNARIWEPVAPYLVNDGLVPIAPDARGHGLTDKPDGSYGVEVYLRDLVAFVETAQLEKPILVGHSWGGLLALEYAVRFPAGRRAPAGLVLVDGGFTQMDQAPGANWEDTLRRLTPPPLAGTSAESFLSMLSSPGNKWQPDDQAAQAILANFEISSDELIYPRLSLEHHLKILRSIWEYQTYERFGRVRCPVLAIPASPPGPLGEGEQIHLELKRQGLVKAQASIKGLQVRWMKDTVHDIPLQRPSELAALIARFYSEIERTA